MNSRESKPISSWWLLGASLVGSGALTLSILLFSQNAQDDNGPQTSVAGYSVLITLCAMAAYAGIFAAANRERVSQFCGALFNSSQSATSATDEELKLIGQNKHKPGYRTISDV